MPLIELPDNIDECWRWKGKISASTGYGHKQFGGHTLLAHRWVYTMFNGHIPDDMPIDHLCKNKWCVNPKHLEPVSTAENVRRGTGTKLTREQAIEIKRRVRNLKWGERSALAEEFGISVQVISNIKHGRAWADLEV